MPPAGLYIVHRIAGWSLSERSVLHLDWAHELLLLLSGLETTMTELGGSVDELEANLLQGATVGLSHQGLTHGDHTALHTADLALEHDVVLVHLTIVGEATEGRDALDGKIELGGRVVLRDLAISTTDTLGDLVHLLVELSTMMVAILASTCHRELYARRMPRTDTGNLAETLVCLTGELGDTPASDNTFVTLTLGDGDGINHLVLLEDGVNRHRLLKEILSELDLILHRTTVDLDLTKMSLLLTEVELLDLSVAEDTHDGAVLLDTLDLLIDTSTLSVLLGVAAEGLLALGGTPVLVEAALALVAEMLSPDGAEGLEATRSLDVANKTAHDHGGALNDGDSLHDLLLVGLGAGLVHVTADVGVASLVAHEGGQVGSVRGLIERKALDLALGLGAALLGEEPKGTMARPFEFAVGHCGRENTTPM